MPDTDTVNLDHYLSRIGYGGSRVPTLALLGELQRLHTQAIAYENLDPLVGRRVSIKPADLSAKMVDGRRGGYCFEQNGLFASALASLGFRFTPLIARVLLGRDPSQPGPHTHMLLRVDVEGAGWLVDVGFGGTTPTAPLRLVADQVQATPCEAFRLAAAAQDCLELEIQRDDQWLKLYRFALRAAEWIDYEVSNWYTSTHPDSPFTHNLFASRVLAQGRLGLFNNQLTERAQDGRVSAEHTIGSAAELAMCLREKFGIDPDDIDLVDVFDRMRRAVCG